MTDGESAALAVAFNGLGAVGIGEVDLEIDAGGDLLEIDPAGYVRRLTFFRVGRYPSCILAMTRSLFGSGL
jgi:hypothetical protein